MRRNRILVVLVGLAAVGSSLPPPAGAAPGDPCPAAAAREAAIDIGTVDQTVPVADRNHLVGRIGAVLVDYLGPPGESLDDSLAAARAGAGLGADARITATVGERSVLVGLRPITTVLGCVDDGSGAFEEVALGDPRLAFTGDPTTDPAGVVVTAGYLEVTVTRRRTVRPVVEVALTGQATAAGPEIPAGDPVAARPPFVG